jgi:hypothetical protein
MKVALSKQVTIECTALLHLAILAELQARAHAESLRAILDGELVPSDQVNRGLENLPNLIDSLVDRLKGPAEIYKIKIQDLLKEIYREP